METIRLDDLSVVQPRDDVRKGGPKTALSAPEGWRAGYNDNRSTWPCSSRKIFMHPDISRWSRVALLVTLLATACGGARVSQDRQTLRTLLTAQSVAALPTAPQPAAAVVTLGQALFFDPELSGNRDVACATCHLPAYGTTDGLSLPIGTGGHGLGPARQLGAGRNRVPRNAPDVLLRGSPGFITMFWDGRVWGAPNPGFMSPASNYLPQGLTNVLAAQAVFPITSRDEMRGAMGDVDVNGQPNELAAIADDDYDAIWDGVVARLKVIGAYRQLFAAAYPDVGDAYDIRHVANAIAAFEVQMGNAPASPWDRFVAGDDTALDADALQGALLFYGQAGCSACHSGTLLTDQRYHNLAVPQIGPGKGALQPLDPGRAMVSGMPEDLFAFRTPPLRNVALTGPWMHNGAYTSLEAVIRHHLDPVAGLRNYDAAQLAPDLRGHVVTDSSTVAGALRAARVLTTLDPLVATPRSLTDQQIDQLLAFLNALTDPSAISLDGVVPDTVPSGLPVPRP